MADSARPGGGREIAFFGRSEDPAPVRELLAAAADAVRGGARAWFEDSLAASCTERELADAGVSAAPMAEIRSADAAFVLGGDGTFLRTARHCVPLNIPLAGINLGYLGFLTDIPRERMRRDVAAVWAGQGRLEKRFILAAHVERGGRPLRSLGKEDCAINDIVVSRGEAGLLLGLRVHINDVFVYELRADGLIVATPSGSTAYALAAGGPIISPELRAMLMVPLCPHALTHRPLAVSAVHAELQLEIIKARSARLHLDGQADMALLPGDVVRVRRHSRPLRIFHPPSYDYYNTLRQKLSWGS